MNIPVERWFKAIVVRHSRRKYMDKKLDEDTVNKIQAVIKELNSYFDETRLVLVNKECSQIFKGIIGSYGNINGNSPAYVAMIGNSQGERIAEKIGYIGEGLILEATSLGLGTCWIAGTFREKKVKSDINLKENEKIYAITPLGYIKSDYSLKEKIVSKMVSSYKRKSLDELCLDGFNEKWPNWIKTSLNCVRVAPSAINGQPWRFKVNENSIILSADNPKNAEKLYKKMDYGIAMLHLEIGALHEGVKGSWEYLESPNIAEFKIDNTKTI